MSNLNETPTWEAGVYQLEETDPVQGGPNGVSNLQGKQLANRTKYLKEQIDNANAGLAEHIAAEDPHAQYMTHSEHQSEAGKVSVAGGTSDALTGAFSPEITVLANGMKLYVRSGSANATTTPTFTPNSATIESKIIVKGAGIALAVGDIAGAGHWIELQYDLTLDKWVLLNPATGVNALGFGQSWQNVAGSRVLGTTYYNTTDRPIFVSVSASSSLTSQAIYANIAGLGTMFGSNSAGSGLSAAITFIVPPGVSYSVHMQSGAQAIIDWFELR